MDNSVERSIKNYILSEFLAGEDPDYLRVSTPLISTGILDSMAVVKLLLFIEERLGVTIAPHEVTPEHLGNIASIVRLVRSKH
ncbi:MAG: acyl carrier protein [Syntrophobacteraceae bacterium]|nr:acyl carrier protein [Syntrophobacteraceae bacterium]